MSTIVYFPTARRTGDLSSPQPTSLDPIASALKSAPKAIQDIHRSIFVLDLALEHLRLAVGRIADPSARQALHAQIEMNARLLDYARNLIAGL